MQGTRCVFCILHIPIIQRVTSCSVYMLRDFSVIMSLIQPQGGCYKDCKESMSRTSLIYGVSYIKRAFAYTLKGCKWDFTFTYQIKCQPECHFEIEVTQCREQAPRHKCEAAKVALWCLPSFLLFSLPHFNSTLSSHTTLSSSLFLLFYAKSPYSEMTPNLFPLEGRNDSIWFFTHGTWNIIKRKKKRM